VRLVGYLKRNKIIFCDISTGPEVINDNENVDDGKE